MLMAYPYGPEEAPEEALTKKLGWDPTAAELEVATRQAAAAGEEDAVTAAATPQRPRLRPKNESAKPMSAPVPDAW